MLSTQKLKNEKTSLKFFELETPKLLLNVLQLLRKRLTAKNGKCILSILNLVFPILILYELHCLLQSLPMRCLSLNLSNSVYPIYIFVMLILMPQQFRLHQQSLTKEATFFFLQNYSTKLFILNTCQMKYQWIRPVKDHRDDFLPHHVIPRKNVFLLYYHILFSAFVHIPLYYI